ncbi:MAG: lysophospholipase [Actinomycetota bacterium]|nr:lysophospholipase [Actinomycetota bacterium]
MTPTERELRVAVDDLVLSGGVFVTDGAPCGVLLLHGIPSTAPPDPADEGYPGLARQVAEAGYSAAWLNMRAAKGQPGFFSIEGWVRDVTAAITTLRAADFRGLPVVIAGSSAGGAVAAEVASRGAPVDGLILLAAPAEWVSFAAHPEAGVQLITEDAGMALSPEVRADPSAWGQEFRDVSTEDSIAQVKVPVLIVHGDQDFVVPPDHASRIAARADSAEVHMISEGSHQLRRDPRAVQIVLDWLQRRWP